MIPFFEQHPLRIKQADFALFADIVRGLRRKEHLDPVGFERLVRLAFRMNASGKQRSRGLDMVLAGSSETARQAPSGLASTRELKIQSDLRGDTQS